MSHGFPSLPPQRIADLDGYLATFTNYEKQVPLPVERRELGPRRAESLLRYCGLLPVDDNTQVVQVAGSKGKGSTVLWLERLLQAAGRSTGATLSPHLVRLNERIRIGQEEISDVAMLEGVAQLHQPLLEHLAQAPELRPTFFDYWTTLSVALFQRNLLDVWILEVGLGGPLDSSSAIPHDVGILTMVDLEHTEWLGPDIDSIAREKAAIARRKKAFILGPGGGDWRVAAREVAAERGAHILELIDEGETSSAVEYAELRALPQTQRHNWQCAAAAFECLTGDPAPVVTPPLLIGRLEALPSAHGAPPLLLDSAHTLASMREFCRTIRDRFGAAEGQPRGTVVFGILQEKSEMLAELAEELRQVNCRWIAVAPPSPRALPAEGLVQCLRQIDVTVQAGTLDSALKQLREAAQDGWVAVTGSFYLAGWFRRRW